MMKTLVPALLLAVSLPQPATAPREALLVTPAWLHQQLATPRLVLLHVGEKAEYDAAHIAGARYVSHSADLAVSDRTGPGLTLEMLPAEVLRERLAALGISDDSHVVVYYGKDWVTPATRVVLTLDYAGLKQVSLLDGGLPAWTRAGLPVTSEPPPQRTGTLSPLQIRPLVVDADFVRSHLGSAGYAVVDARASRLFEGLDTGGSPTRPHKTGHIAGARSVPFSTLTNEDLTWKSPEALDTLFRDAGVRPGDTVITYCHIGQQATAVLFAARLLGHPVRLYDGSFEDWSRRDYPVENPAAKK